MSLLVPNTEKFTNYPIIDRQPFAQHLHTFLNTKANEGYVLNLNAEWGAGKTTFLHCWYNELSKDHPVVYFDAWKSDFSKDAMLALIDCLHSQLASPISKNKALIKSFFEKGSHFVRTAIPSIAVGYLKHKTGIPADESLINDCTEEFGLDIAEKEFGDAIKEVLKEVLEQRKRVEGVAEFKSTLEALANAVVECTKETDSQKNYPVYVLVDELDRCRPDYAIEVIESIKHFFNTKNFIFVIATDTDQLQHSIKAVYGDGFDAYSYLSRFFNKTVTLPPPSTEQFVRSRLEPIIGNDFSLDEPLILNLIVNIFDWHNMTSLREIEKVIQDIEVAKSTGKRFEILPLTVLSVMRRLYPKLYSSYIKSKQIPYRDRNNHVESEHPSYVPKNTNIPAVLKGQQAHHMEEVIFNVLQSLDTGKNQGQLRPWEEILREKYNEYHIRQVVNTICCRYSLNPQTSMSEKSDYICSLELAGHFI
ncbi:KAP family P-loop NTPase fold protein [Vibrio cidicii]